LKDDSEGTLKRSDVLAIALLLAAIVIAAYLRFKDLGVPSYWLDEILGDMLTTHHASTAP
jgi:hypothetical protein